MAIVANKAFPEDEIEPHRASKVERIGPTVRMLAITPNDNVDLLNEYGVAEPCRAILVGVAGNIAYIPMQGGASVTVAAPVGILAVSARRVLATGTTATGLFAGR
jgi:hypothetical protein